MDYRSAVGWGHMREAQYIERCVESIFRLVAKEEKICERTLGWNRQKWVCGENVMVEKDMTWPFETSVLECRRWIAQISACVREMKKNDREKFVMKRRNYRWVRSKDIWREARKARRGIGRKQPSYLGHLTCLEAVGQRMWCSDTHHIYSAMKWQRIKYLHWYNHVCLI